MKRNLSGGLFLAVFASVIFALAIWATTVYIAG